MFYRLKRIFFYWVRNIFLSLCVLAAFAIIGVFVNRDLTANIYDRSVDAFADVREDISQGKFNPFRHREGGFTLREKVDTSEFGYFKMAFWDSGVGRLIASVFDLDRTGEVAERNPDPRPTQTSAGAQPLPSAGDPNEQFGLTYYGKPRSAGRYLQLLENPGYIVAWDSTRGCAAWVAYRVFPVRSLQHVDRGDWFEADHRVTPVISDDHYRASGYDRGHLAPNFAIGSRLGEQAQRATFLMTNMAPQKPNLNRQVWRDAELYVANDLGDRQNVWVVVGPIYDNDIEWLSERRRHIEIPDAFFMIAVMDDGSGPRGFAIILDQDVPASANFADYVVPIDKVESLTGLNFFHLLPDFKETLFESTIGYVHN